ncbi:MAG TPA: GGDEF domain-containing protein [Candidatus Limiplasma sp.]|nr:GGDEF domain-containing protein [Candidatus Limiplasma sp.]HPS81834.1 GGDEF domain-containing protein [Candidatus Limiplasma sp.]
MKNLNYTFSDLSSLKAFLSSAEVLAEAKRCQSLLVQVFSSQDRVCILTDIVSSIQQSMPGAIVVGATTIGELQEGRLVWGTIQLSFSFFNATPIQTFALPFQGRDEYAVGQKMNQAIHSAEGKVAGVLLFSTPLTNNVSETFRGMGDMGADCPVFGAGASAYELQGGPVVFCGMDFYRQGIVAVVFFGDALRLFSATHLGWKRLGRDMIVTDAEGKVVREINHKPAYDVYHKYLGVEGDSRFYFNALEFPMLMNRKGFTLARVPFWARDGAIEFCAEIYPGEHVCIGYGDPKTILSESEAIRDDLSAFAPEAVFIYSCVCRRFLLQDMVSAETEPFASIAPTCGFFTSGEFFKPGMQTELLNSAMVVVGMREYGDASKTAVYDSTDQEVVSGSPAIEVDPYTNQYNRILSRLLHYIRVQTSELEATNHALTHISEMDKLTQVYNRVKLDEFISEELAKSYADGSVFSVILLDIDGFKNVNDQYGHLAGDETLVTLSGILKNIIRQTDVVGRWGGEEFLLILPGAHLEQATALAERIRKSVHLHSFASVEHISCSLGVASYREGDSEKELLLRADQALYLAKNNGRNRVEQGE